MYYVSGINAKKYLVRIHDTSDNTDEVLSMTELDQIRSLDIQVEGIDPNPREYTSGVEVSKRVLNMGAISKFEVMYDCNFEYDDYNRLKYVSFNKDLPTGGSLRLSTVCYAFAPVYGFVDYIGEMQKHMSDFTLILDKDLWYSTFDGMSSNMYTHTKALLMLSRSNSVRLDLREADEATRASFVKNIPHMVNQCIYDEDLILRSAYELVFKAIYVDLNIPEILSSPSLDNLFVQRYGKELLKSLRVRRSQVNREEKRAYDQFLRLDITGYLNCIQLGRASVMRGKFPVVTRYLQIGGRDKSIFGSMKNVVKRLLWG